MVTLVVLLDYSAAFDTVDHGVMLDVLKYRFGLTGSALQWHSNSILVAVHSLLFLLARLQRA